MKEGLRLLKRIGIRVQETQLTMGNMEIETRSPRRLTYTWHGVLRNAEGYNLSAVLSWRLLLRYTYADGPQFAVTSPLREIYHETNAYPVGPFAQYLWMVLSFVSPTLHVLTKHPKTRNNKAEDGSIFGLLAKNTTPKFETQLTKAHNKYWAWTLKRCFLDEVCRSLIPVHNLSFIMRQGSETRLSETRRGGEHTEREWWRRKISLRSFDRHIARRLNSPPVVDRIWNQLGYSTDR